MGRGRPEQTAACGSTPDVLDGRLRECAHVLARRSPPTQAAAVPFVVCLLVHGGGLDLIPTWLDPDRDGLTNMGIAIGRGESDVRRRTGCVLQEQDAGRDRDPWPLASPLDSLHNRRFPS